MLSVDQEAVRASDAGGPRDILSALGPNGPPHDLFSPLDAHTRAHYNRYARSVLSNAPSSDDVPLASLFSHLAVSIFTPLIYLH